MAFSRQQICAHGWVHRWMNVRADCNLSRTAAITLTTVGSPKTSFVPMKGQDLLIVSPAGVSRCEVHGIVGLLWRLSIVQCRGGDEHHL